MMRVLGDYQPAGLLLGPDGRLVARHKPELLLLQGAHRGVSRLQHRNDWPLLGDTGGGADILGDCDAFYDSLM